MKKKVFIAPLNWGLGHATRVLPLIKEFLKNDFDVYIGVKGRSLELLKMEVPECYFVDFPEYPIRYPRTRFFVTRFMFVIFPQMLQAMRREANVLHRLQNQYKFDLIISDNRFRLYKEDIPSYLISHQLRYKLPFPIGCLEWIPEYFNSIFFNKYDKIFVPDNEYAENLAGELAHQTRFIYRQRLFYTGILTDVVRSEAKTKKDIDFLIIVSGPEPQRTKFEKLIFQQIQFLKGNVIAALGKPESDYKITWGSAVIYSYLNREKIAEFISRAKFIIGRPGYTLVMELVELGKKALFIPTPGQVEQVYLAKYYLERGWCYYVNQNHMDLEKDVPKALSFNGFPKSLAGSKNNARGLFRKILHL